ncbi:MAG: RMD1 family protein [Flavobacterium sp.]|nr:MAG: RMD1 family protein [Flavobacterium sp.]
MYTVRSIQIARHINIRAAKDSLKYELIFNDSDELFYKLDEKQYLYIFQFGIVCFFNVNNGSTLKYIERIKPFSHGEVRSSLSEDFLVFVKKEGFDVSFNSVTLPYLDQEMIRLVMLHTSQSVALDRYAEVTGALLEEASIHTSYLERKGTLNISKTKLKRLIGKNLRLKNGIYENLYIFDAPESTWEDEKLAILDNKLKHTFDLKNRYRYLQDRIDIIKENLQLFKDIWDHKESSTLEWIIIILIFVEIIDLFVGKIF